MKDQETMVAGVLEYAALAILYSLLAAAILEALLKLWRVQDPPVAVRFRLLILAVPPVAPLLFGLLNPERGSEPFRRQVALLDLWNWLGSEPGLSHPGWLILLSIMAATTILLAGVEAAGFLRHIFGRQSTTRPCLPLPDRLREAQARLARPARDVVGDGGRAGPVPVGGTEPSSRGRGLPRPAVPTHHRAQVLLVPGEEPMAYATGLRRPTVLVSTRLVEMLDGEELECVLAHELAHLHRRDNWVGWLVFSLRLASFYNPVALFTFHQISHDTERVCDAEAARATGKPLALASALIKVCRASCVPAAEGHGWSRRLAGRAMALENRARRALVTDRVERLVHPEATGLASYPHLRLALALAGVLAVSYLVV